MLTNVKTKSSHRPLVNGKDIERIAKKGTAIYEKKKKAYDPKYQGQFLAIEVDSGDITRGETNSEALDAARQKHPRKLFFVVKVGHSAADMLHRLSTQAW